MFICICKYGEFTSSTELAPVIFNVFISFVDFDAFYDDAELFTRTHGSLMASRRHFANLVHIWGKYIVRKLRRSPKPKVNQLENIFSMLIFFLSFAL